MKPFATILRSLMLDTIVDGHPISQSQLGRETGITQPTIARLLDGREPKLSTLYRLARFFGVDMNTMTGIGTGNKALLNDAVLTTAMGQCEEIQEALGLKLTLEQKCHFIAVLYHSEINKISQGRGETEL